MLIEHLSEQQPLDQVKINIEFMEGHWYLHLENGVKIRTPYRTLEERHRVVGYALRAFPDSIITEL